jgi:hypothetical protein
MTIIPLFILVLMICISQEEYLMKMTWIDFLQTPASTLLTTLPSNHPGHGFLTVTKITELTCAVSVFIFAQWMAASISLMLSYLMAIEKRTAFQNLVGVDFVLLTNAPLLTCCVVLNVL